MTTDVSLPSGNECVARILKGPAEVFFGKQSVHAYACEAVVRLNFLGPHTATFFLPTRSGPTWDVLLYQIYREVSPDPFEVPAKFGWTEKGVAVHVRMPGLNMFAADAIVVGHAEIPHCLTLHFRGCILKDG